MPKCVTVIIEIVRENKTRTEKDMKQRFYKMSSFCQTWYILIYAGNSDSYKTYMVI